MNRKNGTSPGESSSRTERGILGTYREFAPTPDLRGHVRAYFSFTPGAPSGRSHSVIREVAFTREDSFRAPTFADGHASLVMELGTTCHVGRGWTSGAPVRGRAMGALQRVRAAAECESPQMLGVYFEPGATAPLLQVPAMELTDLVVDLEQLWGSDSTRLAEDLADLDEMARVDRLDAVLRERLRRASSPRSTVDVVGLAHWVRAKPAGMTVNRLAEAAGMSRRHLTRVFRDVVGVSPKRYCILARFQAALAHVGIGAGVKWAHVAAELGYADQSHMIAEFRDLSSLTPEALATRRWFHPFILEARSRRRFSGRSTD